MKEPMHWTPEQVDRLLEMVEQGYSASEAGRELGCSKNACIAKARRLNAFFKPKGPLHACHQGGAFVVGHDGEAICVSEDERSALSRACQKLNKGLAEGEPRWTWAEVSRMCHWSEEVNREWTRA